MARDFRTHCLGFQMGGKLGACLEEVERGKLWCAKCEERRRAHMTARLKDLASGVRKARR